MAKEFRLPDPGEGIHEAEIVDIQVGAGDSVEEGDVLLTVETDKANVDVPASFTGSIEELRVSAGDDVRVGDVLLTYSEAGAAETQDEAEPEEQEPPEPEEGEAAEGGSPEAPERASTQEEERPAQQRRATDAEEDEVPFGPVPAAPSTRRLARELDVDLKQVYASSDGERITDDDVRRFAEGEDAEPPKKRKPEKRRPEAGEEPLPLSEWPLTPRQPVLPDFERWGPVERTELRSVRRATAQRMALSWTQVPHVTHEDTADITELELFRREQSARAEEAGVKLTLTALVVKVVAAALREFPRFNASLDTEAGQIVLKQYYHVGVAVATERGLMVPVVRDADRKNVLDIAGDIERLAERARDGELDLEEMRGGTFSVTNPGGIGGTRFTPIINFPQVAILGCGRAALAPVSVGDLGSADVEQRYHLPLCLAFDHRVNDGADAARFARFLCDTLADPGSFALTV
jgi:pyruvate dehydrogenase E2 component (dihydrolipoamide acetyltransferase)